MDIADRSEHIGIELNFNITNNLVAALNECSEYLQPQIQPNTFPRWSQIYILESLMAFTPQNPGDAELIAERIAPRLQHANSGVVLTTIKVILYLTNYMIKDDDVVSLCKKLSPPLGMEVSSLRNDCSYTLVQVSGTPICCYPKCTIDSRKTTRNFAE